MKSQVYFLFLPLFLFTGCSIPLKSVQPPVHTYRLSPHVSMPTTYQKKHKINLYIPNLEVTPGLDSKNMMLIKTSFEQDFIANCQWPDELPVYLHSVITDTLSASNAFTSVSNKLIDTSDNFKLLIKFSEFQAELLQEPSSSAQIVISMEAFLINSSTQKLLMHQRYHVEGKQVEIRVSAIVKALNDALGNLLVSLIKDIHNIDSEYTQQE